MWDILFQNWPILIVVIIAIIICGAELIKAIKVWRDAGQAKIDKKVSEQQEEAEIKKGIQTILDRLDKLDERLDKMDARMAAAEKKLQELTESDMHDIKAWIVEQYHKFYNDLGWIDAFSAETLDRRYQDYRNEGGNSYVEQLMDRLHTLPMDPPNKSNKSNKE